MIYRYFKWFICKLGKENGYKDGKLEVRLFSLLGGMRMVVLIDS